MISILIYTHILSISSLMTPPLEGWRHDLRQVLGANLGQLWGNMAPKWPRHRQTWTQMPPLGSKMAPLGTTLGLLWVNSQKRSQKGPKMGPKCSQNDAQRYPKWPNIDQKMIPKWYCWTLELAQLGTENWKHRHGKNIGIGTTWNCLLLLGRRVEGQ